MDSEYNSHAIKRKMTKFFSVQVLLIVPNLNLNIDETSLEANRVFQTLPVICATQLNINEFKLQLDVLLYQKCFSIHILRELKCILKSLSQCASFSFRIVRVTLSSERLSIVAYAAILYKIVLDSCLLFKLKLQKSILMQLPLLKITNCSSI